MLEENTTIGSEQAALTSFQRLNKSFFEIFHSSPMPSFISSSRGGNIVEVNESCLRMLDCSRDELIGQNFRKLAMCANPESRMLTGSIVDKVKNRKSVKDVPISMMGKNGKVVEALVSTNIINVDGINFYISSFCDITERKRAEDELLKSEEKYRHLFQNAPIGLFRMRISDRKIIACNERFVNKLGYGNEDECCADFMPREHFVDPLLRNIMIRELVKEGKIKDFEMQITRKDGTPFWVELSAELYMEKNILEGAVKDINARKQAEAGMRESNERFDALFKRSFDCLYVCDLDGRIIDMNCAALNLLGYEMEEIVSMNIGRLIGREDIRTEEEIGSQKQTIEYKARCKDGRDAYVEVREAVIERDGKAYAVLGMARDITERKRIEESLRKSEQLYRSIANQIASAVWTTDRDLRFNLILGRGIKGVKGKPEQLIGTSIYDFFGKEDNNILPIQAHERALKGESIDYNFDSTVNKRSYWLHIEPFKNLQDEILGVLGIAFDITSLKLIKEDMKKKDRELEERARNLEEVNSALRVLLKRREEDRIEFEEKVLANVRNLILPIIEKMKNNKSEGHTETYISIIESNLKEITSSFSQRLSSKYLNLTPKELQVASLIKEGKESKDIAQILHNSQRTVDHHRKMIRKKLGLHKKRANLKSFLLNMTASP